MKEKLNWLRIVIVATLLFAVSGQVETNEADDSVTEASEQQTEEETQRAPTVFLAILARNTAHTLPYFFSYIDRLDYPKNRMYIWLQTDNNIDNTSGIIEEWISNTKHFYHKVNYRNTSQYDITDASTPYEWSHLHYTNMVMLRQEALDKAREVWADYLMFVDCDNFLTDRRILKILIAEKKPIIAPMLTANRENSYYANFWCGINEDGYYKRTEEYIPTLHRHRKGCYEVPMVHSTFLVDLRLEVSNKLAYWPALANYNSDIDDVLQFAHSAREAGMKMYVINKEIYGFLIHPQNYETVNDAINIFNQFKIDALVDFPPVVTSEYVSAIVDNTPNDTLGFDHVFMINLERRVDRHNRMAAALKELHVEFEWFKAVDGRELNDSYAQELGIKMLPGWKDPWGDRPITKGEIGCFLSHYFIWERVVQEGWKSVLIFEDDIKFVPYFRDWIKAMLGEIRDNDIKWDLIYIGRKRLHINDEIKLEGLTTLIYPKYSYWTLCYMVSQSGATKLLAQRPLQKMLPVDEYFPIMFNEHPRDDWAKYFWPRDLIAYSADPLFVTPTHYVGDEDYFSDTEPLHVFKSLNQKQMEELEERKQKKIDDKEDYMRDVHSEL